MNMEVTKFTIEEGIAKIVLNRPDVYNSVNTQMAKELQTHLDRCKEDDVRVVYITGEGKAFCAGQDLKEVMGGDMAEAINKSVSEKYNPLVSRIYHIEKPVICAVNGVAAGAGANIALVCDIVVAKESAKFVQVFSNIGLIPDSGGTYVLPRLIGFQKALALALLADKVPAPEAERMGMIYKYFPDESFEEEAWNLAVRMSKMPTRGLALTKKAFNLALNNSFEEQLEVERKCQMEAGCTHDFAEGVMAFLQKRTPDFKGN